MKILYFVEKKGRFAFKMSEDLCDKPLCIVSQANHGVIHGMIKKYLELLSIQLPEVT